MLADLSNLSIFELVTISIFVSALLVQLFYYLFFYLRITFYKVKDKKNEQFPVSIIICAKDEAQNLENFLPSVLEQDYPEFEVIVVNDGSEDDTENILKRLDNKYKHLYVTRIPKSNRFRQGKKLAVTIGLKAAKNEWVLLTDADCEPVSKNWISKMQANFKENTDIVLGYGGYFKQKGFLNKLIRFDSLFIAMQYFTFAKAGIPYMGVGRNLAYRKSVFFKNKGFASHLKIKSGDDDLLVNKIAHKKNIAIELSPESFTRSVPETNFNSWYYQKKRHLTTGRYYKFKHKFVLGLEILSRLLFYLSFLTGLIHTNLWIYFTAGFLIRFLLQLIIFYAASVKLKESNVFYFGIIFDFILPLINFIIILSNIRLRKKRNGFAN
jgi:cellulose synthase/poly-beta-1,6-N-acetylglucosamine synthase-like glycosyltransferase